MNRTLNTFKLKANFELKNINKKSQLTSDNSSYTVKKVSNFPVPPYCTEFYIKVKTHISQTNFSEYFGLY